MRHLIFCALCLWAWNVTGQMAPDFTITDSHGTEHTLYADYLNQGKTVMIKIFFTTCPPCNVIAPFIQPLYEDWGAGDYDVEFFELSNKGFDTDALVNAYQANHGQTFPGAGSEGGSLAAVSPYEQGQFGPFYGTPTFVVIAPDGTMDYDVRGFNNAETIAMLDAAIAATGAMQPECSVTITVDASYCAGDSVQIRNTWYNEPGTYQQIVENEDCDTLLWITIFEDPLVISNFAASFCSGDSIYLFGLWFFEGGSYCDTIFGIGDACDTIVMLDLTVDPLNEKSVNASFNEGDSVLVYGMWYGTAGVYTVISESLGSGCDTVVTITVTEIPATDTDLIIGGKIRTFSNGSPVAQAIVAVWLSGAEVARDTTDQEGNYSFTMDSVYVVSNDLEVLVFKDVNPKNGVTVLDIVALQKHLLGFELLNRTDKLFAADINGSGTLSALDIVELRKLLLGIYQGFPNLGDPTWMIFPEAVNFGPPGVQPPVIPDYPPVLLRLIHSGSQSGNFRGLKLGDLNDTSNPLD